MTRRADTLTYIFYYRETVTAKTRQPADVVLDPILFDGIKASRVGHRRAACQALDNFQITVVAEAIQAGSFADAADAWSHF